MFTNADEVLRFIGDNKVEFVDVRFCDLPGTVQHFTVPAESFGEKVFTDGLMFDGSSIRGFQQIHESDMLLLPDPATAVLDPFRQHKTLNLTFFVHDPQDLTMESAQPTTAFWAAGRRSAHSGHADRTAQGGRHVQAGVPMTRQQPASGHRPGQHWPWIGAEEPR